MRGIFDLDVMFQLYNLLAMVGWLLMIFLPRWKWTGRLVLSGIIPLIFAFIYFSIMSGTLVFGGLPGGADFSTFEGVRSLFQREEAVLVGWVHYLAFDMVVGAWELRDSQRLGINHFIVIPCLIFTFMLGPVGLLLYFIVRSAKKKQLPGEEVF